MTELDMDRAKSTTPSFRLTDAEAAIDMARLRGWRLARVRAQLEEQGYGGCLLFDPVNARYACGARNHTLFHTHIIGRHLFVPTEGPVILFDGAPERLPARHLETVSECRELPPINFFFGGPRVGEWVAKWADEMAALVARHCGKGEPLGIDQAAPHVMAALQERGLRLVDAQAADGARACHQVAGRDPVHEFFDHGRRGRLRAHAGGLARGHDRERAVVAVAPG